MKFNILILFIFICSIFNLFTAPCPFDRIASIQIGTLNNPAITETQAANILEVGPEEDFKKIKNKYQKLIFACHPDRNKDNIDKANNATRKIDAAFTYFREKEENITPEKELEQMLDAPKMRLNNAIKELRDALDLFNNDDPIIKQEGLRTLRTLTSSKTSVDEIQDVEYNLGPVTPKKYRNIKPEDKAKLFTLLNAVKKINEEYLNLFIKASLYIIMNQLNNEIKSIKEILRNLSKKCKLAELIKLTDKSIIINTKIRDLIASIPLQFQSILQPIVNNTKESVRRYKELYDVAKEEKIILEKEITHTEKLSNLSQLTYELRHLNIRLQEISSI